MGDGSDFESDVRNIARLLWSEGAFSGAKMEDGRERDGIFETRDGINVVECTISRAQQKAIDDAQKTVTLVQRLRKSGQKHANGWLVTKFEPTADQRSSVERFSHSVRILSFEQFRSLLFNGREYLRLRGQYKFGSVADPVTKSVTKVPAYLPIDLYEEASEQIVTQSSLVKDISEGKPVRVLLLGEYGSGKSMTLRYIFMEIARRYGLGTGYLTPLYLNLRDHTGQRETVEALERHARLIAYPSNPGDLVRAWRSGHVVLFLDGFDEMATTGWGGSLHKVRHHRHVGMTLIRKFLAETPDNVSIIVAGRDNFFDNPKEMCESLGLNSTYKVLRTDDFSEQQASIFIENYGTGLDLPDWLPRRPVLLTFLAASGVLEQSVSDRLTPAQGWNQLLTMICEREAQQDERLDPDTVRRLLERLATIARATEDGRGRIDILTIQNAFKDVAGFPPDETAQQFILRLPALGPTSLEDSSREFVDQEIADAARSGDVLRYIEHPYGNAGGIFESAVCPLGEIGASIVSEKYGDASSNEAIFGNALKVASTDENTQQLAMDMVNILLKTPEITITDPVRISGSVCQKLLIDDFSRSFSNIEFLDCLFPECDISLQFPRGNLPTFRRCLFGSLDGFFGKNDLPDRFIDCEVSEFLMGNETSAKIMRLELPAGFKLLLTVLKKLFLQKGAGRQEAAFYRGAIDPRERRLVPEILQLLEKHDLAEHSRLRGRDLWRPNRSESARVRRILASPATSVDPVVAEAREL